MARNRKKPSPAVAAKSVSIVKAPEELLPSQSNPDSRNDQSITFGMGVNPLTQYRQETDFFARRAMCWEYAQRCTATCSIADSVADELASQEIYITPTEVNPSATTLLLAQRGVDIINNSMLKSDGLLDFIHVFVESYFFSKTGAFILTPKVGDSIEAISILNPMRPFPYYGWTMGYEGTMVPVTRPSYDSMGNLVNNIEGIWHTDGAYYYTIPMGQYHQVTPGSYGFGAWLDTKPRAEHQMAKILAHTVLVENLLDTILCTDASQAIIWSNVDPAVLIAYSQKIKEIRRRRLSGQKVDPEDQGTRLHVTAREPDKPASGVAVNFRAFPEGFDPIRAASGYEQGIAVGHGVHARRAAPDVNSERFGNAQQAAMLNSDEPGVRAIKHSLTQFYSGVLLSGVPLRVDFMAVNSPENYAVVAKDAMIAQAISQVGAYLTKEQIQLYLLRMGFMLPSEAGVPSMRTGDGSKSEELRPRPAGFASLRWSDGQPILYNPPIYVDSRFMKRKADPGLDPSAEDFDVESCTLEATARYEDWMTNELPDVLTINGISRRALEEEVDDLAQQIFSWMVSCARTNIGSVRTPEAQAFLDELKTSWFNAIGSPRLRGAGHTKPSNNLFDNLWGVAGKVALGTADVKTLQQIAARFTSYIARYFNALRSLAAMIGIGDYDGGVDWVRSPVESCRDCIKFEGHYSSMKALKRTTGGLLPGDPRLTCSGNCKCRLVRN